MKRCVENTRCLQDRLFCCVTQHGQAYRIEDPTQNAVCVGVFNINSNIRCAVPVSASQLDRPLTERGALGA
ncbi:hypothetical protein NDU88_005521 [Pleurodeles waltl]|uniref:Uncharacterized protein n=1 Tax=Pleurodeles waltl TaxID=8319 RepID=A0AAV7TVU2_PLEWA|nr:hypothetical protein NDU88_005010 [Pleurodeles waltl]KAJ1180299.1 hypothetical protein NDU88_005521 [Pleurodeles waltl]